MGVVPSDPERLRELLSGSERHLDRLMAVIAGVAADAPPEDEIVTAFDRLAAGARPPGTPASSPPTSAATPEAVLEYVCGGLGFVGNTADYYNPANSLVHRVLADRRGIPISLAAVAVEIGRRLDVHLTIVGLPGHVVLGDGAQPKRWFDPFAGGAELDVTACRTLYARFNPVESFTEELLRPIGPTATVIRMLNNLKLCYRSLGDLARLVDVLALSVEVPGMPVSERHDYAVALAAVGRYEQAAEQRELLVELDRSRADAHRAAVSKHRARRN